MQVISEYRYLPAKIGLWTVLALSPVWGALAPYIFFVLMSLVILKPGDFMIAQAFGGPLGALVAAFGMGLISFAGVYLTCYFAENRIVVAREGLHIRGLLRLLSFFFGDCPWTEIKSISIKGNPDDRAKLILERKNGNLCLDLNCLSDDDRERLLLSVSLWANPESCHESLSGYLHSFKPSAALPSFTQLWEDELSNRFSATAFVPLEPGTLLQDGKLKILKQLSFGGLSAIYLCQKEQSQILVLKELVLKSISSQEAMEKALQHFKREAQTLCRLQHPNVVRVLDHFVENERNYILLEHIQGTSLRQLIREQGVLSEIDALRYGLQLCHVLSYLHKQAPPLVHRDLTPDNIVLRSDGQIIVIDFGAANEYLGQATGTIVGKEAYMAPEQFRGKAQPASDLYSLGASLYFLLTGKDPEPFSQSSVLSDNVALHSSTDCLIQRCTDLNLEDRFKSVDEVEKEIDLILSEFA